MAASRCGRTEGDSSVSGVVSTTSEPPFAIRASACRRWATRRVLSSRTTGTLRFRIEASSIEPLRIVVEREERVTAR